MKTLGRNPAQLYAFAADLVASTPRGESMVSFVDNRWIPGAQTCISDGEDGDEVMACGYSLADVLHAGIEIAAEMDRTGMLVLED